MKKVYNYNDFLKGLSPFSELVGGYADCRDIDPHRSPGYIMPGFEGGGKVSSEAAVLAGLIVDAKNDPGDSAKMYAVDKTNLYQMTSGGTILTTAGDWPFTATGAKELFFFHINDSADRKLFVIKDTDMGMCVPVTPSYDDDWFTAVLGEAALTSGPHPTIEWKKYRWIGNGRYLARFSGAGANGAWVSDKLDLGVGWEITSLFPTQNYIGVCAWKSMSAGGYRTECKVFFYDGSSTDWTYYTPIAANKIVTSYNDSGEIFLITTGTAHFTDALERLTTTGTELVQLLSFNMEGTDRRFIVLHPNTIDIFQNRLMIGSSEAAYYRNCIFSYGSTNPRFPKVITQPYSSTDTPATDGEVGFVGHLQFGYLFASYFDGTYWYWQKYTTGSSVDAYWKGLYTDMGQKIRVNYVKFYFKPLVASDSVTPTLEVDYGTSWTLSDPSKVATITYTTDGAITSKRFNIHRDCHAFRPVITWAAGGVAFSKVVVDYTVKGISDN